MTFLYPHKSFLSIVCVCVCVCVCARSHTQMCFLFLRPAPHLPSFSLSHIISSTTDEHKYKFVSALTFELDNVNMWIDVVLYTYNNIYKLYKLNKTKVNNNENLLIHWRNNIW